jgi:hypothetical protein
MSTIHMIMDIESGLRNVLFKIKDRTMDNIQNYTGYINDNPRSLIFHICLASERK